MRSPGGFSGLKKKKKCLPMQETEETWVGSLGGEDPLKEGIATHSSILAWRISWTEGPGRLRSIGLQRVGYDWSNLAHTHAHMCNLQLAFKYMWFLHIMVLHLWINQPHISCCTIVFIEKNWHVWGPAQFETLLFRVKCIILENRKILIEVWREI